MVKTTPTRTNRPVFKWTQLQRDIAVIHSYVGIQPDGKLNNYRLPEVVVGRAPTSTTVGSLLGKLKRAVGDKKADDCTYVSHRMCRVSGETEGDAKGDAAYASRKKKAACEVADRVLRVVAVGLVGCLPTTIQTSRHGQRTAEAAMALTRKQGKAAIHPKWGLEPRAALDAEPVAVPTPAPARTVEAPPEAAEAEPEAAEGGHLVWSVQFLVNGRVQIAHDLPGAAAWSALVDQVLRA